MHIQPRDLDEREVMQTIADILAHYQTKEGIRVDLGMIADAAKDMLKAKLKEHLKGRLDSLSLKSLVAVAAQAESGEAPEPRKPVLLNGAAPASDEGDAKPAKKKRRKTAKKKAKLQ